MIGQTISHYKIIEKLGEGGMGVVYKAQDLKLDRLVALKFLPRAFVNSPETLPRFRQEARAASALNHQNILTIYDFEEADNEIFIAMEFVEGQSLKSLLSDLQSQGRLLPLDDALAYAVQIAEGLSKAHAKGIVHRDIKSDNIMLTADGLVKIMDFGLAKLRGTSMLTKTGSTVGTLSYMSPEQLQGVEADQHADVYALGVVLYEMIAGRLPFQALHEAALMYEILNTTPPVPSSLRADVDSDLEKIILRCIEKKRENRYPSMQAVLSDLKAVKEHPSAKTRSNISSSARSSRTSPRFHRKILPLAATLLVIAAAGIAMFLSNRNRPIDSIAVLPFKNVNADPDVEYLSDGITENLINALSRVSSLRVVPRSIVFGYKGKDAEAQRVGEDLKVRAVLTGRVVQRGDNLNVQAELVDVANQSQIWGEQYNRKMTDIIVVQEEIARQISEKLRLQLTREEQKRLTKRYTENTDAYQLYLKGYYFVQKATPEAMAKGLDLLKEAIRLDPNFALPYAGLALYYGISTDFYLAPHEAMPEVKKAAAKALELDNEFSTAHAWLGWYDLWYSWNWKSAKQEFEKAIELNPNEYLPHFLYSFYFLSQAQFTEAVNEGKRFLELEPLTAEENAWFGLVLYFSHQYDKAFEQLQKALEFDDNFPFTRLFLGFCYLRQSKHPQALAEFQKAHQLFDAPWTLARLGYAHAIMGNKNEARKILYTLTAESKKKYVASDIVASMYVALGDKDRAFEYLDKGFEERAGWMIWLKVDPIWDPLRTDPRFVALLKRMDLEPSEAENRASSPTIEKPRTESAAKWQNSIAVLPFKNISSDKEQEYFCDGMTEQLITNLTNLPNVKVIARTSVMQFKNSDKTIQQIAQELGVAHVLEGSVRKSGNKVRVTAQLIKADDGFHLWAKDYDRLLKDIFAVQDDVSNAIVEALKINLTIDQKASLTKRTTEDTEAYQIYLLGRFYWNKRTQENTWKAVHLFEAAIAKDSNYALAYSAIADCYVVNAGGLLGVSVDEAETKARTYALKALQLDSTLVEPRGVLAQIRWLHDWDLQGAEEEFNRALRMNPNDVNTLRRYAYALVPMDRNDEAVRVIKDAYRLDPLSFVTNLDMSILLYYTRRFDEALAQSQRTLEMDPSHGFARWVLAACYWRTGKPRIAGEEFKKAGDPFYASLCSGRPEDARKALEDSIRQIKPGRYNFRYMLMWFAQEYGALGLRDQTLQSLEKAYAQRSPWLIYMTVIQEFDYLHSDPRFVALSKKMGLVK